MLTAKITTAVRRSSSRPDGLTGGTVRIKGDVSSQFLTLFSWRPAGQKSCDDCRGWAARFRTVRGDDHRDDAANRAYGGDPTWALF